MQYAHTHKVYVKDQIFWGGGMWKSHNKKYTVSVFQFYNLIERRNQINKLASKPLQGKIASGARFYGTH